MSLDVVQLTRDLVAFNTVSLQSNVALSDWLISVMQTAGFITERLEYVDVNGERKVSVVGRRGQGIGGLALFSHSDTVPGTGWSSDPFRAREENGRLIGLGSCDMKGPLAATLVAAAGVDESRLKRPVLVAVTSDEENGGWGAQQIARESQLVKSAELANAVIAEPTQLTPVYAHKGGCLMTVTAHGVAAHTSTGRGVSANFLMIPFLTDMAELAKRLKTDPVYQNAEFDPPTHGFNLVIDDGKCATNVTPAKTVCKISFRPMPDDRSEEILAYIRSRAEVHGLDFEWRKYDAVYTSPQSELVQTALQATGAANAKTVPFGTDAFFLKHLCPMVVLGPGNIAQAHTDGEWIDIQQLQASVTVYHRMIEMLCM